MVDYCDKCGQGNDINVMEPVEFPNYKNIETGQNGVTVNICAYCALEIGIVRLVGISRELDCVSKTVSVLNRQIRDGAARLDLLEIDK